MTDTRDIHWKKIGAEGVAIVVSILLAFWIDAWWDNKKELNEEKEILIGLEIEFTDLKQRLDFWAEYNNRGRVLIEQFLSSSVQEMDAQEIERALTYASIVNILDQGGPIDAIMASGRLEKITDREIRSLLTKWPDWLDDIHTNDISARRFAMQEIVPFLAKHGFPGSVCEQPELFFICAGNESPPQKYVDLASNEEFRSLLIMRRAWLLSGHNDHSNASKEAENILNLISKRLKEF